MNNFISLKAVVLNDFFFNFQEEIKEEAPGTPATEKTKPITIKQEQIEEEGNQQRQGDLKNIRD